MAFAFLNAIIVAAALAVIEGGVVLLLEHPPPLVIARKVLAGYYGNWDRSIIQFMPECSTHDPELTYILRPGRCRFANREFDTEVRVNSLGTRDDEASLHRPSIVVLGDSQAMGWGVEESETFSMLLEGTCGQKVLNAAVPSYGTAREIGLLKRVDTDALDWLIVQYHENDLRENFIFKLRGNVLTGQSKAEYEALQTQAVRQRHYFPGKHAQQFARHLFSGVTEALARPSERSEGSVRPNGTVQEEVEVFLNVLARAPSLNKNTRVIVLEVSAGDQWDPDFTRELRRQLATATVSAPWRSLKVVDPAERLRPSDFLVLDHHLNAQGHRVLAAQLSESMGCRGPM